MKDVLRKAFVAVFNGRRAAAIAMGALALVLQSTAYADESYPSRKPISLIVPYPAGGASDLSARIFSEAIGKAIGQTVVVENIGGATGVIAANRLLKLPNDGYQIFHGSPNELILPTLVNKSTRFKPEDFELVQTITTATLVVLARSGLNVNNLDELITLARQKESAPLTYASVGMGSLYHLIGERLAKELGLTLQHVPYQGATPALTNLAGGQVDFAILPFSVSMLDLQKQGRLKIVSTLGKVVPDALKNIPLITDSTLIKNMDYRISAGYYVKAGTPEAEKAALRKAIGVALETPAIRKKLELEGRVVAHPMNAAQNNAYWADEIKNIRELVELINYKPQ